MNQTETSLQSSQAFSTLNVRNSTYKVYQSYLKSIYIDAAPSQQTQSSYCLVDRDTQEEEDQRKKDKEKKKNRLSKGLMELINMGDPLGYGDKKLIK